MYAHYLGEVDNFYATPLNMNR